MSKISIKNLSKSFCGNVVLKNINLSVDHGEFISLLGLSGCGKTTLLNLIAGLEEVDVGEIYFDDQNVTSTKSNLRSASIVFQDYLLFPHMTVFENISFGLKVKKISKQEIKEQVNDMLDIIGLKDKEDCYPRELSGGQKQRVAIARSLIVKPKVLLLDEPFSGLDKSLKFTMMDFVLSLVKQFDITTIMVTHDKKEAFRMSNRVAILHNNQILAYDTPKSIYKNPGSVEVAKMLSTYNIIDKKNSHYFGDFEKELFINYNELKLVEGNDFRVSKKSFLGEYMQYEITNDNFQLTINDKNEEYNIGDLVSVEKV